MVADEGAELAAEVWRVAQGAVPVANDGLGDQGSEVVVILPADTLDGNGNVRRRDGVVTESDLGADEIGLALLLSGDRGGGRAGRLAGKVAEVLLGQLHELLVGHTTSANEDHAVRGVVGLDVVDQVLALDALDVLLGSEDGAAEGLALERGGVQVVEDDLLELLVDLLLLTQDHITLPLDRGGLQLGVLEDVGQDVNGLRNVRVEGLGVVDGVLPL